MVMVVVLLLLVMCVDLGRRVLGTLGRARSVWTGFRDCDHLPAGTQWRCRMYRSVVVIVDAQEGRNQPRANGSDSQDTRAGGEFRRLDGCDIGKRGWELWRIP